MKDNFFDPASLALDEDEEAAALPSEKHRFEDQFQDPLIPLSLDPTPNKLELLQDVADAVTTIRKGESPIVDTIQPLYPHASVKNVHDFGLEYMRLVLAPLSFDALCQNLLDLFARQLNCRVASFFELDSARDNFFFRATVGSDSAKLATIRVPRGHGLLGQVEAHSRGVFVQAGLINPDLNPSIAHLTGLEIKDCLAVPVYVGGKFFGIIEGFNKVEPASFGAEDLTTAESAVEMIAKVLEVRFAFAKVVKRAG